MNNKKVIQVIKTIAAKFKHSDVLVVLEGGENSSRLVSLINEAFDGKSLYATTSLNDIDNTETNESLICSECNHKFKSLRGLKIHFKAKHKNIEFAKVSKNKPKDKLKVIKKYLEDNPKKVLILQRTDNSIFIEGQKDVRPLKYLDEEL